MITLKDYKDWLKGYEIALKQSEVEIEQANIMIPVIKQKIEELEKLEVPEVKNGE